MTPSTSIFEYLNSLLFSTSVTMNVPLYDMSSNPFGLLSHLMFFIITCSPTFKLCGLSVLMVILAGGPLTNEATEINLVLRSKSKLLPLISFFVKSLSDDTFVELES